MSSEPITEPGVPTLGNLHEFHLNLGGREWTIRHAGVVLSYEDEAAYLWALKEKQSKVPYGLALWPSSVALAHELAARAEESKDGFSGVRVLELGAGTGLPGIVAASFGATVVQTDFASVALELCEFNGKRNHVSANYRLADWTNWAEIETFDLIIGADILYAEPLHGHLKDIFPANLAPNGSVLLADPFRTMSLRFFEALEVDGWQVGFTKWNLGSIGDGDNGNEGEATTPRPVGVFELRKPA